MNSPKTPSPDIRSEPARRQVHWPSVWQFALSGLAIFYLWNVALVFAVLGLVGLSAQDPAMFPPLPMFIMAAGMGFSGVLLLPSAYYALWRVLGRKAANIPKALHRLGCLLQPALWIFALPVVLAVGYLVGKFTDLSWLFLPFLHILAVGIPVAWLLYLAVRDLPLGSPQRAWGMFGSGLVLAPALILVVEGLAMLALVVLGAIVISGQPGVVEELISLSEWLVENNPSPEEALEALGEYILNPATLIAVVAFGALVVPLIEEALKPIGLWLLAGRKLRPAAGFAAGALCGAGYAFFESIALASSSGDAWAALMAARSGTAVIHILTTGMTGWALVQAWGRGRYVLLGVTYLGAVAIHGLWNGLTLFFSISSLGELRSLPVEIPRIFDLGVFGPYGLIGLAIGGFVALLGINRVLARPYLKTEFADLELDGVQPEESGETVL